MMSEPELSDEAVRAAFHDLARTELAAPRPMCECKCNGMEPHADRLCFRPATTLVALHMWAMCDQTAEELGLINPADLDGSGNLTSLMCDRCASHAKSVARSKIMLLLADPDTYGARPECPSCHRVTMRWQDILERRPL